MNDNNLFKEILTNNAWQENLNIWRFQDQTLQITQFANPKYTKSFEYSITKAMDRQLILTTPKEFFGYLLVTVNWHNSHPKLIFESDKVDGKFIELEAFRGFSDDDKRLIENLVMAIQTKFQLKQSQLKKENNYSSDDSTLRHRDRMMQSIALKIETMEMVVRSTNSCGNEFSRIL